jgi:hypothetical protein
MMKNSKQSFTFVVLILILQIAGFVPLCPVSPAHAQVSAGWTFRPSAVPLRIEIGPYQVEIELTSRKMIDSLDQAQKWLLTASVRTLAWKSSIEVSADTLFPVLRLHEIRLEYGDAKGKPVLRLVKQNANADSASFVACEYTFDTLSFADRADWLQITTNIDLLRGSSDLSDTVIHVREGLAPCPTNGVLKWGPVRYYSDHDPFRVRERAISYSVGDTAKVVLVLYDQNVELVDTLVNRWHTPGIYWIEWVHKSPGYNYYSVEIGEQSNSKNKNKRKMMILLGL